MNYRKSLSGTYESIIALPNIEGCKIVQGMSTIPIVDFLKKSLEFGGNMVESCSSIGEMTLSNLTFENSTLIKLWPDGEFKTRFLFFDELDDNIYNVTYYSIK